MSKTILKINLTMINQPQLNDTVLQVVSDFLYLNLNKLGKQFNKSG